MVINGAIVSDLDMMFIESVLQEETSLCMMMRSARLGINATGYSFKNFQGFIILLPYFVTEPPDCGGAIKNATDDIIESLVCPPPPCDNALNEEVISSLIVPAPGWSKSMRFIRRFQI